MSLEVSLRHRQGDFTLDVDFRSDGGLSALFGRSGAGKTTVINAIAGLLRPDEGRIVLGDRVLLDTERRIFLPPHRRRLGYVFQEGRLFPHLSVRQNLLFGRWFAPRGSEEVSLDHVVEMLGIEALLHRRPPTLSGGEKQRVAIGRALLAAPRLLLMDEPLASLDEARKGEILPYIERLRDEAEIPVVYVSHSVAEVMRLADQIVLLSKGKVAASGPLESVLGRSDLFPAAGRHEAGALWDVELVGLDETRGLSRLDSQAGPLWVPPLEAEPGTQFRVRIRARDVMIALERPHGISALNIVPGQVTAATGEGAIIDLQLDCSGLPLIARITRHSYDSLGLAPGRQVFAVCKSIAFDRRALGRRPRERA